MSDAITIHNTADIDEHMAQLREAATKAREWISQQTDEPIAFLKSVKFERKGFHPVTHKQLNLIEQINQTWTYLVALEATRYLLQEHPEAGGFSLAPGATASQELDIMSVKPGLVGAETFAATSPGSNGKLGKDRLKLAGRTETHRYIFFACPAYSVFQRRHEFEKAGILVYSVSV